VVEKLRAIVVASGRMNTGVVSAREIASLRKPAPAPAEGDATQRQTRS
jgi:hypothetical protein